MKSRIVSKIKMRIFNSNILKRNFTVIGPNPTGNPFAKNPKDKKDDACVKPNDKKDDGCVKPEESGKENGCIKPDEKNGSKDDDGIDRLGNDFRTGVNQQEEAKQDKKEFAKKNSKSEDKSENIKPSDVYPVDEGFLH